MQNVAKTFNDVGLEAGMSAGTMVGVMSSINNIARSCRETKRPAKPFCDAAKATGKAAINGYLRSGGIATATQIMRSSTNNLIKVLGKMNAPAEILSAVAVAGSALSRYCSGEITLEDCVVELHKNAATLAASTTGMAVGEPFSRVSQPVLFLRAHGGVGGRCRGHGGDGRRRFL